MLGDTSKYLSFDTGTRAIKTWTDTSGFRSEKKEIKLALTDSLGNADSKTIDVELVCLDSLETKIVEIKFDRTAK